MPEFTRTPAGNMLHTRVPKPFNPRIFCKLDCSVHAVEALTKDGRGPVVLVENLPKLCRTVDEGHCEFCARKERS